MPSPVARAAASHVDVPRRAVGANSKTNAVFLNHSPGALEDLAQAVQKGFMASSAAPGASSMLR